MNMRKKLSLILAFILFASCIIMSIPKNGIAASQTSANSFTVNETGIEIGKEGTVKFTAEISHSNVNDLTVYDENNNKVAVMKQDSSGKYVAEVKIKEDKKTVHTYTLNTDNGNDFSCDVTFYEPLTDEDINNDNITWEKVSSYVDTLHAKNVSEETLLKTLLICLKMDKNVSKVWYETDRIINFETIDGVCNVFDLGTPKTGSKSAVKNAESDTASENTESILNNVKSNDYIGNKNICVIAPYYGVEDDFTTRYIDEAETLTNITKGKVTAYYGNGRQKYPASHDNHPNQIVGNGKADVTAFKNLDNYGIIMIDSHGSLYNGQSLICVNETTGTTNADYSAKRLVNYRDQYDSSQNYVGVLGTYISYYTDSLPNSIVFLGSCFGMYSTHLKTAFRNLGAGFVTGFSQSVSFIYENQLFNEYFKKLRSINSDTGAYYTTLEAFKSATSRFGDTDPYGSGNAKWKYDGNTSLHIGEYVAPISLEDFEISPSSLTIYVGETQQLSIITTPADAIKCCTVSWESFDDMIASVDSDGLLTAECEGTTIIACSVEDEMGNLINKSISVNVIEKDPEEPTVKLGDVNGDDTVNTADAVALLRYSAGNIELTDEQLKAADTTKDSVVNTGDAVAILKYAAGILTEF